MRRQDNVHFMELQLISKMLEIIEQLQASQTAALARYEQRISEQNQTSERLIARQLIMMRKQQQKITRLELLMLVIVRQLRTVVNELRQSRDMGSARSSANSGGGMSASATHIVYNRPPLVITTPEPTPRP